MLHYSDQILCSLCVLCAAERYDKNMKLFRQRKCFRLVSMILLIVILLVNLNSISEASNELAVQDIKEFAVQPDEKYEKDNFPIVEPVSGILAEVKFHLRT